MSQFHHAQYVGDNDINLWQQQLMYKQLQDIQRQQIQHPGHAAVMQNQLGTLNASAKTAPVDQPAVMFNEMPANNPPSYAWTNNTVGADSRYATNPQMFMYGNMNWQQYSGPPATNNYENSVSSNSHAQNVRSVGFIPQQPDQVVYSTPPNMNRGSGNQYSQYSGTLNEHQNVMAKMSASQQVQRLSVPPNSVQSMQDYQNQGVSFSMQSFEGRAGYSSNASVQNQDHSFKTSPFPMNNTQNDLHSHSFTARQTEGSWNSNLQDKLTTEQPGKGGTSLDPEEAKILFGGDDGTNWGALAKSGHESSRDYDRSSCLSSDNVGAFPSLQSGSWSALMQEALEVSSSENGLQEEWSGLSLNNNTRHLASNSSNLHCDGVKKNVSMENNLQSVSTMTTRSFALHNNSDRSVSSPTMFTSQQPGKSIHEQIMKFQNEPSTPVNSQHSPAELNNSFLHQSLKQNDEYRRQQYTEIPDGKWPHLAHGSREADVQSMGLQSVGTQLASKDSHGIVNPQQNIMRPHYTNETTVQQNMWNTNDCNTQGSIGVPNAFNNWKVGSDNVSQMTGNMNSLRMHYQNSAVNSIARPNSNMPVENLEQTRHATDQNQFVKNMQPESSHSRVENCIRTNHNIRGGTAQTSDSSGNNNDKRSENSNQEFPVSNERQCHDSNHEQNVSGGFAARINPFYVLNNVQNAHSGNHSLSQPVQQVTGGYVIQNHPSGSTGMNFGHMANSIRNNTFKAEGTQDRVMPIHAESTRNLASEREFAEMQKREEVLKSQNSALNSDSNGPSFGAPDGLFKSRNVQTSQNMLELLQKADQSNRGTTIPTDNASYRAMFDNPFTIQQMKPPTQGTGLQLGPPPQRSTSTQLSEHKLRDDMVQEQLPPSQLNSQSSPFRATDSASNGQQAVAGSMFKNVWTNMSSGIGAMQPGRIPPSLLQSMIYSNKSGDMDPRGLQDVEGHKAVGTPSEGARSMVPSTQVESIIANPSSLLKMNADVSGGSLLQTEESMQNNPFNRSAGCSVQSMVHLHQHNFSKLKPMEDSLANYQTITNSNAGAASGNDIARLGTPPIALSTAEQNYSLLNQMQSIKRAEFDSSSLAAMNPRADVGPEPSQGAWKSGQRAGQNSSAIVGTDNNASPHAQSSHASDSKIAMFASRDNDERSSSSSGQFPGRESSSHDIVDLQANDRLNHNVYPNLASNVPERKDQGNINSQMAPGWIEQHTVYRNDQTLAVYAQKNASQMSNLPRVSWGVQQSNFTDPRADSPHFDKPGQFMTPANAHSSGIIPLPAVRLKKRKSGPHVLLSWSKVIERPQKLQSLSLAEVDWAEAANRLTEKIDFEAEILEEGRAIHPVRRRLILTTQLTQHLFPAIPSAILKAGAASSFESVAYATAKLVLSDACGMISLSMDRSPLPEDENRTSEVARRNDKLAEAYFSKVVGVFGRKFEQIETAFAMLEKRASILDVQLECQELERFAIVNRLGKYHGRSQADGQEGSESFPRRPMPQRQVIPYSMPGIPSETGVFCLSL